MVKISMCIPCVPYTKWEHRGRPVSPRLGPVEERALKADTPPKLLIVGAHSLGTSYCKYEGCRVQTNKRKLISGKVENIFMCPLFLLLFKEMEVCVCCSEIGGVAGHGTALP